MRLWRVSRHVELDGIGGTLVSGRWSTRGRPVVYAADHPALAVLEAIVQLGIDRSEYPVNYRLLEIDVPDGVAPRDVAGADLPAKWREQERVTRAIGDGWLAARRSALLRVPSAVVRGGFNVLINPEHADASRIRVAEVTPDPFDPRLFV